MQKTKKTIPPTKVFDGHCLAHSRFRFSPISISSPPWQDPLFVTKCFQVGNKMSSNSGCEIKLRSPSIPDMIAFKKYLKRLRNITRPAWSRRCAERRSPDQSEPATWNPSLPGVFWSLFIGAPALWCDPNAWRDQRVFPIWSSEPHAIEMVARMRPGPWKTSAPQVLACEKFHTQMWIHSGAWKF